MIYANTAAMLSTTHELVTLTRGDVSLKHIESGEVMHSNVGPREEARLLYVEQSRLAERICSGEGELVLYDVGLGAATNALAALQCHRTVFTNEKTRPLRLISFESDLSGLRLAYEHRQSFPYFDGLENAVESLLTKRHWSGDGIEWQVIEGDFRETARGIPLAEVVFFDFYSPKTNSDLWNVTMFNHVRELTTPNASLYTYSASTRVRSALLAAGFFVGYGQSTGTKTDTTVAARRLEDLLRPLDARWLERLRRSDRPLPHGWPVEKRDELITLIEKHPQFQNMSQKNEI